MKTQSLGTTVSWNAAVVAELESINGIEISVDLIDSTTYDNTDAYKTFVGGLIEAGEIKLDGYFSATDMTGQIAMLNDMNSRTNRPVVITFPVITGMSWAFTGIVTKLEISPEKVDGLIKFSASIKPSGKPTFSTAVSTGMTAMALSNAAILTPAFAIGTFDYVATVLTGVASLTITPTATGVITVNGNIVTTATPSGAIILGAAGSITVAQIGVTETNKATKLYKISIVRA